MLILATFLILLFIILKSLTIPVLKTTANQPKKEKLTQLGNWLDKLYRQGKFNGSILLAKDEQIIYSQSFGYNSFEQKRLLDEHASYNLASVSKQFTAMGIMLLRQQKS